MSKRFWYIVGVAAVLGSGCGQSEGPAEPRGEAAFGMPDVYTSEPQRPLPEMLDRPRVVLAGLGDTWLEKVRRQQVLYRQASVRFELLPELRLPLAVPVWRQAKYSAKAGMSLPPYLADGGRDAGLALHLARFGDVEAARQLAGGDPDVLARLDGLRLGRNYPAEWTRLAALMLYHHEFRLAAGDAEAAHDLLKVHEEVRKALDDKAQAGPLGAALLPRGWSVLHQTAAAWKANGKEELGQQIERALSAWGQAPSLKPALTPGTARADVARLLGGTARGRALLAPSPLRALDVLGLPFPDEQAEAVVACFDPADRLTDVLVVYQSGLSEAYPRPAQLAQLLEEHTIGEEVPGDLPGRRYRLGSAVCDVVLTPGSPFAGGLVRAGAKAVAAPTGLPRDFGLVRLDRSFTQNRIRLAPRQSGSRIAVTDAKTLAALELPVPAAQRAKAVLQREGAEDVVAGLTVRYTQELRRRGLTQLALPLWQVAGAGQLAGGGKDGALALAWEDSRTRYVLHLPQTEEAAPELEVADRADGQGLRQQAERAHAWDRQERRERLDKQRPLTRLPRELEGLRLGAPRAAVLSNLPSGEGVLKRDLADGVLVTVLGAPQEGAPSVRELYVHFDRVGAADGLRVRYAAGAGSPAGTFLKSLQGRAGAAEEVQVGRGGSRSSSWQDDLTALVCREEAAGLDVTLWDRPRDQDGDGRRPLAYLPRGPEGCALAMSRDELARGWGALEPAKASQPLVLTPKEGGPHDALLVWLEADRVVRVVARHRQPDEPGMAPAQAAKALAEAWGQEAAVLGWPRHQQSRDGVGQSWANHDDRTQVRVFWQQNRGEAPRVYTEWLDLGRP